MTESVSYSAVSLMALMKFKGIGRASALRIVNLPIVEASLEKNCEVLMRRMAAAGPRTVPNSEVYEAWRRSEEQLTRSQEFGIQAISFYDDTYPARLRKTPDPPAVLFAKGNLQALDSPKSLAVVGTREPTQSGKDVARKCGRTAAESGYAIISGLALGCDAHAHEGCLEAHGVGTAVLAHGLDNVYPAANRGLAERLLEDGGCLTSEYPIGTRPVRSAFPERNRIQSGLSDGVLVIETGVTGGTMHTARFARIQGRALACCDHLNRKCAVERTKGNRKLIDEDGAVPIPNTEALKKFLSDLKRVTAAEPPLERDKQTDEKFTLFPM